jgi:hypothetical protein
VLQVVMVINSMTMVEVSIKQNGELKLIRVAFPIVPHTTTTLIHEQ